MGESPSALRRDVDEARDQLGETVEELAYRVTAPKRAVARARARLASPAGAVAAVAVLAALAVVLVRQRD
jgi:4-hydroxyphenylpyruvate dioxygenase-like putative hemolysin